MTTYFGPRWDAPMLDGAVQTETPVGKACMRCGEPIREGEPGLMRYIVPGIARGEAATEEPIHAECDAIGIVGHQYGICACEGWDTGSRRTAQALWKRMGYTR
jgi:hypothetical protein